MAGTQTDKISGRLVRSFAIIGGGVMVLAVLCMGTIQYYLTDREISREAERNNEAFTAALATLVGDKIDHMLSHASSVPSHVGEYESIIALLDETFTRLGANSFVLKVNLFDPMGRILYSTSAAEIGTAHGELAGEELDNPSFKQVLQNHVPAGERSFRSTFEAIGGPVADRYVLSNYLPLFADRKKQRLIGVFEIYSDVTEPVKTLFKTLLIETGIAIVLFGSAYVILMSIVWKGAREIDRAHDEKMELAAAMADINAASQAKSNFLMSMSHELKTPLNAILGFSEIIKDQRFGVISDQRYRNYAGEIHQAGAHLLKSVEDILDLTRLESGQMKINAEPTDPTFILASVAKEMEPAANAGNVRVRILPSPENHSVVVDSRRVRQVLRNLLDNAVKFSRPNSEVELSINADAGDGQIEFCVADKGSGMAKEQIPEKISPFGAKRDVLTQQTGGLGLGLPLSQRLAQLMGAALIIESAIGKGTIVRLRLRSDGRSVAKSA